MVGNVDQRNDVHAREDGKPLDETGAGNTDGPQRDTRALINAPGTGRPSARRGALDTQPLEPDLSRPNSARIYDYYLDGCLNYEIDRAFARQAMAIFPAIKEGARDNRGFLQRAVRYMAEQGVRQFLDLGCGITSVGSSWETATQACLDARVICVDEEPVAVHAIEAAIGRAPDKYKHVDVIQADFTDPDTIFRHPWVQGVFDLSQPIGILMVAVLHFVGPGDQPQDLIKRYMARAARGSYVAVSVAAADDAPPEQQEQLAQLAKQYDGTSTRLHLRDYDEVLSWFNGLDLISPSSGGHAGTARLAHLPDWQPEHTGLPLRQLSSAHYCAWCGVARKSG